MTRSDLNLISIDYQLENVTGTADESPVQMYTRFYLFNITNSEEVMNNKSINPILQELGPYTYT